MKKNFFILLTALPLLMLGACDDNSDPDPAPPAEEGNFIHSVIVGENSYISVFKDLEVEETNTTNSLVLSKSSFLFGYKDCLYVLESSNARIYKYKKEGEDLKKEGETLVLASNSYPQYITFVSEEKAYVSCLGLGGLVVFNPKTMTVTKTIDLSSYALGASEGDFTPEPTNSVLRDNLLYVCLVQDKSQYNPHPGAYMLILDIATDQPVKMIQDERATMSSAYEGPIGDPFIDEKGDIYIYCVGAFGYIPNCNEGFLRIKKGETEFDPSYYFPIKTLSIPEVTGNKADYVYQKVYAGNGKVYAYLNIPGYGSNPPDYVNDKTMQPFVLDVYNKTLTKLDFDASVSWATGIGKYGDNIIFGMSSTQGTGYYIYNMKTKEYFPRKIKTQGTPFRLLSF